MRFSSGFRKTFSSKELKIEMPPTSVPVGYMTEKLSEIEDSSLVINEDYGERLVELRDLADSTTHRTNSPIFRMLQIMKHTRDQPARPLGRFEVGSRLFRIISERSLESNPQKSSLSEAVDAPFSPGDGHDLQSTSVLGRCTSASHFLKIDTEPEG